MTWNTHTLFGISSLWLLTSLAKHTQVCFQTGALDAAELAKEISGKESREEIRATIISQGVGEAYLVRREQPSVRIRTARCPDLNVKAGDVAALRQASFDTYARARSAVEQELKEREQHLASLDPKGAKTAKPTTKFDTPRPPVLSRNREPTLCQTMSNQTLGRGKDRRVAVK